jgi:hypothetical protein
MRRWIDLRRSRETPGERAWAGMTPFEPGMDKFFSWWNPGIVRKHPPRLTSPAIVVNATIVVADILESFS